MRIKIARSGVNKYNYYFILMDGDRVVNCAMKLTDEQIQTFEKAINENTLHDPGVAPA